MHQSRRRKKRPNYGVRTVEIARGKNGFGFTISGQAPCILSCIVNGSPAERAGLRPGDYLIAVNGMIVSKMPHDDVVGLIGSICGMLKLQISENIICSDSSDEEFVCVNRSKQKYHNRVRHKQSSVYHAEKVVQDVQNGSLFCDKFLQSLQFSVENDEENDQGNSFHEFKNVADVSATVRNNKVLIEMMLQRRLREVIAASAMNNCVDNKNSVNVFQGSSENHPNHHIKMKTRNRIIRKNGYAEVRNHMKNRERNDNHSDLSDAENFSSAVNFTEQELNNILYPSVNDVHNKYRSEVIRELVADFRAVVGYLGTIEMPKEPQVPGSRLQAIRSCIRRLRIEKKVHTLVLLSVYSNQVLLTNPHGLTLAEYPAEKITFSGVYADDKKFFGLVTGNSVNLDDCSESTQEDNTTVSSSCHVFMVDARIQPHYKHMKRARVFRIDCTMDPVMNLCQEFPDSAAPILQAIGSLCRNCQAVAGHNNAQHPLLAEPGIIGAPGLVIVDGNLSSPQRSNTSSNSSNSDSGIGFRDEGGSHNSDRALLTDLDNVGNLIRQDYNHHHHHHHEECNNSSRILQIPRNLSTSDSSLHQVPSTNAHCRNPNQATTSNGKVHSAQPSPLTVGGKSLSPNRLTVRAMPDPVGFISPGTSTNTDCPFMYKSANTHGSMKTKNKATSQKYLNNKHCVSKTSDNDNRLNVRAMCGNIDIRLSPSAATVREPCCTVGSDAVPCSSTSKSPPTVIDPALTSQQGIITADLSYKLSPKVYGVEIPLPNALVDSTSTTELSSKAAVDSSDDEHNQDGRHHLSWSSASQYSDHLDSEIDRGIGISKYWIDSSYLKKFKRRSPRKSCARDELGTVSDGELATNTGFNSNIKPASSSATSSMIGLDRISTDTATSIQAIAANSGGQMSSSRCSSVADHERGIDVSRVATWAVNFEKLLEDPAGMHTFAEFLKSEFSQENILFWVACERYKNLKDIHQIKSRARDIYEKHLGLGALEPVNVDSHARQIVQDNLDNPTTELFSVAQKQIYDLMKFDCYSRFLKCLIYKDCMIQDMNGHPLPYHGDYTLNPSITWEQLDQIERDKASKPPKNKESSSGEEKRSKRSIIPWHRGKTKNSDAKDMDVRRSWRRKKKNINNNKENKSSMVCDDSSVQSSDLTGSRTSLTSVDLDRLQRHAISHESLTSSDFTTENGSNKESPDLCRIILPDQSTTVVQVASHETIRDVVKRLGERRALSFTAVDVYPVSSDRALDQNKLVSSLSSKELRIERRIIFRVDLPNKKTIGVKAKATKNVIDILRPIVQKYGFKLDNVIVHVSDERKKLNVNASVSSLDNKRLVVKTMNEFAEWGYEASSQRHSLPSRYAKYSASLNEITNKVFEDLLKGKAQGQFDELGILDLDKKSNMFDDRASSISDTRSSSSNSGLLNLVRRSSFNVDNNKNRMSHKLKMNMLDLGNIRTSTNSPDFSVQNLRVHDNKNKSSNKSTSPRVPDSDELFEVWKRAQRSRLEDQRGTQINGELPEFLKLKSEKEAAKYGNYRKRMKNVLTPDPSVSYIRQTIDDDIELPNSVPLTCFDMIKGDGIIPTHQQAEDYFSSSRMNRDSDFSGKLSLADIGFASNGAVNGRIRSMIAPSYGKSRRSVPRPVSHPSFDSNDKNFLTRMPMYPTIHPLSPPSNSCRSKLSDGDLDKTLECANDLDLDSVDDLDMTVKVDDASFSPSMVPPPDDMHGTTLHVDKADFPPPTPIMLHNPLLDSAKQLSLRLSSPPPLPPKPKLRGPPPRPPSRPQSDITTAAVASSSPLSHTKMELVKQPGRSRKAFYVDKDNADRLNISFV